MSALCLGSNGLYKTRTHFAVELHPSTLANVEVGVKEELNLNLMRYVDEFDGVLLSYSNIEILTKKPLIHPYFPYFHLDVRADVLVFKPTKGMRLVGRVNHLGADYISALVLGVFNVSIPARSITKDLHFLREELQWIHLKQPEHQIKEHSYVVFKVEEVKDHGGFFQITGSMEEPGTGAADFLHPNWKLPEPTEEPGLAWSTEDAFAFNSLDEPATTAAAAADDGGAGPTPAVVKAAAGTGAAEGAVGAADLDGGRHGGNGKRRRNSDAPEDHKGKRRRKEVDTGAGTRAAAAPVTPGPAATETREPQPARDGTVDSGADAGTRGDEKGEEKQGKGAGGNAAGKEEAAAGDKSEKKDRKKDKASKSKDKDKGDKQRSDHKTDKDKGASKEGDGLIGGAAAAAAAPQGDAAGGPAPQANGGAAPAAANGRASHADPIGAADGRHEKPPKGKGRKLDKGSSEQDAATGGKEPKAGKKEGKESSKKEKSSKSKGKGESGGKEGHLANGKG